MSTVRVLFWATHNHLFWGSAITPDLITSWWWVLWSVASSLSLRGCLVFVVMEREGGDMPALPSLSRSLCLCFGSVMCCQSGRRRDGQSQWSAVKSRLCLMNRGALPSHWAEFTSSHNHLFFPSTSMHLSPFVSVRLFLCCVSPRICSHLGLFLFLLF